MDPYFFEFVVVSSPEYLVQKIEEERGRDDMPAQPPTTRPKGGRTMWDLPDPFLPKEDPRQTVEIGTVGDPRPKREDPRKHASNPGCK